MTSTQTEPKLTVQEVVDYLREKIKDDFSILDMRGLRETDTMDTLKKRLAKILSDIFVESGLEDIIPEQPIVELVLIDRESYRYEVRPQNETAKIIIQMMNLQMPHLGR